MKKILISVALLLVLFTIVNASTQTTTTLDIESPTFLYEETQFNDGSSYASSFEFDYTDQTGGNETYYIKMPKNSTILNATMNVAGEITTVYKTLVTAGTNSGGLLQIDVSDITSNEGNEIAVGTQTPMPNVFVVAGPDGSKIWDYSTGYISVTGCYVDDLTPDPGNEIAFVYGVGAGKVGTVVVLNANDTAGTTAWSFSADDEEGRGIAVGNIDNKGRSEVVYATLYRVYILNGTTGEEIRNISAPPSETPNVVLVGNVSCYSGNQILVGTTKRLHIYDENFTELWNSTELGTINSIDVGDVLDDPGNEIAIGTPWGTSQGKLYLFNTSGPEPQLIWNITLSSPPKDLKIGDAVGEYSGNEIVVGDQNSNVYTFDKNGNLIWKYNAAVTGESWIESVDIGDLTSDEGNEVAAGGQTGWLYVFNFDYFPANVSIDVGDSGSYDWSTTGKLRETKTINTTQFKNALQSYLDSCTPDSSGNCNVPLVFHSDWKGRLKISDLNVTYEYNASNIIKHQKVLEWSRTKNIRVNESVGNESINISFVKNPANPLQITGIKVNSSSTKCDFGGSQYPASGGVCDIPDFTLPVSGILPSPTLFWQDGTMTSDIPVLMNVSSPWITYEEDNYKKRKNITIWSTDPSTTFYNVTTNVSISEINGESFLSVNLFGDWYDITPNTTQTNCNTNNPTYTLEEKIGYKFYVCKQDTNGDSVVDFFKWKQGQTSTENYIVGGSTNLAPELNNANVTPSSGIWSTNFNYTINVTDKENNGVNVTLWVFENKTGWSERETKNVSGSGLLWFYEASDKNWTGLNKYKFEYFDYNQSNPSQQFHSPQNTSEYSGPTVLKKGVTITHIQGNATKVNRTETQPLSVLINDSTTGTSVGENVSCAFWVTLNGTRWNSGYFTKTNSSGYCNYNFTPDGNYSVEQQWWKAGIYNDEYYENYNSTNFTVEIHGKLNISITRPEEWGTLYRNRTKYLEAKIVDQYEKIVPVAGYNCSFWLENIHQWIGNTTTNSSGYCSYQWQPNCSLELGNFSIKTLLSGNSSELYTILNNEDQKNFKMKGELNITIINPQPYTLYHKTENIILNSTVNDSCMLCNPANYETRWYLNWYKKVKLNLKENSGRERINEPYVISGEDLANLGLDISQLEIQKTRVVYDGSEVPVDVLPWDENKTSLNSSQIYLNNNTEIVFLTNISSGGTKSYWLLWNESNHPQNISFIRNGGFENGTLDYWNYTPGSYIKNYTKVSVVNEGSDYSAYILAYDGAIFMNQTLARPFSYVKMKYRAWGTYDDGSYAKIITDKGECNLNLTLDGVSKEDAPWWKNVTCGPFSGAKNVSMVVYDNGSGDYDTQASHLLIDYICIVNETGNCLNPQSGLPLQRLFNSQSQIGSGNNITYHLDKNEDVGKRRFFVNASGEFYKSEKEFLDVFLYGWSYVNDTNVTSDYCIRQDGYSLCAQSSPMTAVCLVKDKNSSEPIRNYNVSFYNDTWQIGWNLTDQDGIARFNFNSSNVSSTYNVLCNITDSDEVYYNISAPNSGNYSYEITSGTTNGTLSVQPLYINTTDNITKEYNFTFQVNITLNNSGNGNMYAPHLNAIKPDGIYISPINIPSLGYYESFSGSFEVFVTNAAPTGVVNITWNVTWTNGDSSKGFTSNITQVYVKNNTILKIPEDKINSIESAGFGKDSPTSAGNFTIESFGNTELRNITFSLENLTANDARNWITLDPSVISIINKTKNRTVLINLSIPVNASAGIYLTNITANSERSSDSVLFNLTVNVPDWTRTPESMNKTIGVGALNGTIGYVTIDNNINRSLTFNLSLSGNTSLPYVTLSNSFFEISNKSKKTVTVFYNRTDPQYQSGVYVWNLTIKSLNSSSPAEMKTEILLNVVNLTVSILSPTSSNKVGPINASDVIEIYTNVTKPGLIIKNNVTFEVFVGGESCSNLTNYGYWSQGGWQLKCSAPEISDNPILNNLLVKATYGDVVTYGEEPDAVIYYDITPPRFSPVDVSFVNKNQNVNTIPFNVKATDNSKVDNVWAVTKLPNNTYITLQPYQNSSDIYYFNFTNPNLDGDYDITVYANDTGGTYGYGNNLNSTNGWFDVYIPNQVHGVLRDPKGEKIDANFTFYRPGENFQDLYKIAEKNTEQNETYNWTLHKRYYDIKVDAWGQEIKFSNVDLNSTDVENPFRFDYFPNKSSEDISNIQLPDTANRGNVLLAIVADTNRSLSNATFTINYTDALKAGSYTENLFEVFVCHDWNYSTRTCDSGNFTYLVGTDNLGSSNPDTASNTFTFSTNHLSAFAIAESSYPSTWGISPPTEKKTTGGGTTGGGGTGAGEKDPFTVDTNLGRMRINRGESDVRWINITNNLGREITVQASVEGEIKNYLSLSKSSLKIPANGEGSIDVPIKVPEDASIGPYYGKIKIKGEGKEKEIDVTLDVKQSGEEFLSLNVHILKNIIEPKENLKFQVKIMNLGLKKLRPQLIYSIKDEKTEKIIKEEKENITVEKMVSFKREFPLNETELPNGAYMLEVIVEFNGNRVSDSEIFEIAKPLLMTTFGTYLLLVALVVGLLVGIIFLRKYYLSWKGKKKEKIRYLFPVNFKKIPQKKENSFWIGRIADTDKKAWFDPNDLTTHILVAGATGAGKSVAASVFVEEALEQKIPVIVFDPTAQFTGFMKPCEDTNILRYYKKFGLDERDAKSYKGLVIEVEDPYMEIDFKKYMNPGEVTIFTLNKIGPEKFDAAVTNIIDSMFKVDWEESTKLKLIVVFDEVHRLLEKYGGRGGYKALERACREFRKWGIGLIMCSQVLNDFKEAVAGNVLTDVQLNTKSLTDIEKVKDKYGIEYANRVTRQGVGVGMLQNPKYNEGKPYFVNFRPTYHNPHKITKEEMEMYNEFAKKIKKIEEEIAKRKERGENMSDVELEFKLAYDKLKLGKFRMAKLYITSLMKRLNVPE